MSVTKNKKESHANRGMDFEKIITNKIKVYIKNKRAYIIKVPTDWCVTRKYNPRKKKTEIVTAFPREASISDYLGVLSSGQAVAIETKRVSSNSKRFPFDNIKPNQYTFFDEWIKCGGIGYYLIWFKEINKCYLIESNKVQNAKNTIGRKSIPIDWFNDKNNAIEINEFNFLEEIERQVIKFGL